jgi:DNA-binding LacI/PurR family transcriptional regulator
LPITHARVQRIIDVLGYQSHLQAQNLRVGCAMIIALLYPTQNDYLMTVIASKLDA